MQRLFMIEASTRRERKEATSLAFDCINRLGGWIDDSHMFSNIMTNIRFTIAAGRLGPLLAALGDEAITIEPEAAGRAAAVPPGAENEQSCTLQLTFIHDEPDLRREIPAVPG